MVAIPKVQPRFAVAIWKKYPTMKSLLSVYMDPSKSVSTTRIIVISCDIIFEASIRILVYVVLMNEHILKVCTLVSL